MDIYEHIEKRIDKLDEKLDNVANSLSRIDVTLAKQQSSLDEHMRRTSAAEENLALLRSEFKPIQTHVIQFKGIMKFIGAVGLILGIVATVLAIKAAL